MFAKTFQLDPRLKADTFPVKGFDLCDCLLMNDKRWPWLIMVPRRVDLEELDDLSHPLRDGVFQEVSFTGEKLKAFTGCKKINIAAIGNIVRQLHIHVIARDEGDPNWPGPVWGFGQQQKYSGAEGTTLAAQLKEELRVSLFS